MKTLSKTLRFATFTLLAVLLAVPAQAGRRSNVFGRNSRSMMGMSDDGTGELYTVTPGVKSLRAHLKGIGSMGYSAGGKGFTMRFSGNSPKSARSLNGSRMSFTNLRGGGMRALMRSLKGAKQGKPMTIFPGSGALAENSVTRDVPTATSFRFGGFDKFGYTREQIINDVPLFGQALAQLLDSGFGSVNLLLQRLSVAIADPLNEIPADPDAISALLTNTATKTISDFDGSGISQEISSGSFDLLAYLRSLLDLLPSDVAKELEPYLTKDLIALLGEDATLLSSLLQELNDPNSNPPDYLPTDPALTGTIEFADDKTALLETEGSTYVYLVRNGGSFGEVKATVSLGSPGSAVAGKDFKFKTQTVTWKDGEAGPKAIAFTIVDDKSEDGDVDFSLNVAVTSGTAPIGSVPSTTILIVDNEGAGGVAIARNTVLVCEYTWPKSMSDLDTGTTFLNETVGFNYADYAPYLLWTGDDRLGGGREVVVVDIDSAVANGDLPSTFNVDCMADWYMPEGGYGPATLGVYFRDKFSTKKSPKVSADIAPSPFDPLFDTYVHTDNTTKATTPVATVGVTYDSDAGVFTFGIN